jgi:hypothetical protein
MSSLTTTTPRTSTGRRTASTAAFLAAAGFIVEGLISLVHHTGDDHWDGLSQTLNIAYLVSCVALVVALPAVGVWLAVGRVGRAGILAAQVGYAAMAVESVVSSAHDGNVLGGLFFGGLLLALVGLLVLAVAASARGHHRWAAALPFVGMLVGTAGGEHGGSIVLGAVWVALGTMLVRPGA